MIWGRRPGGVAPGESAPRTPGESCAPPACRAEGARGSRIGDVTRARIAPGWLARIEPSRIPSGWARIVRVEVDSVERACQLRRLGSAEPSHRERHLDSPDYSDGIVMDELSWQKRSLMSRVPVRARAPESVAVRRSILGAQNIPAAVSSEPSFRSGTGVIQVRAGAVASDSVGCGASSAGSDRLVLEVLLRPVGQYSEQGVMLHVCCKALQGRPFGMSSLKVGARRALRAVGGAWRDSANMCYSGPGAGRSGGVLPGPVALRALEVASYRRSRGQGSGSTTHL